MLVRHVPQRTVSAAAKSLSSFYTARTFSTTLRALDSSRSNPLIGGIQQPPVSTERPRATTTPSPSRAPASSAEVPPNADLPPPPPPPAAATPVSSAGKGPSAGHKYDAKSPVLNLADLIGKSAERYMASIEDPTAHHRVHTRPTTGRTVFLHPGRGSAAAKQGLAADNASNAFRVLDRTVRDQKIKNLFYRQRFHERKGMKRKRLRMDRWRNRFKDGFKATASRVLELKKQGW